MRRILFILFILTGLPGFSPAAIPATGKVYNDKPLRIELPARSVNESYRIIPCGKNGMIMFFRSLDIVNVTKTKWYFSLYDTNMQLVWVKSAAVLNDLDYRFSDTGQDTLSFLFLHSGKSRSADNDFEILRMELHNGSMVARNGKIQLDAEVMAFSIAQGRGWIGYNVKGQAGRILQMKLNSGTTRSFPMGQGSQISINWMSPDTVSGYVSAVVSRQVSKKTVERFVAFYDTAGVIKREIPIGTQDLNHGLTHVQLTSPDRGAILVMGSFGLNSTGAGQKNKFTDESTGFFTSFLSGGTQRSLSFYNFLELTNASSLIDGHDILNLKQKALKKNKTLAEYSLDFPLLLHEVFLWKEQYILAAEAYSPQYHTETFTDFDYYGRPYTNSFSVFDGYRFFNTIITGFDKEGKLLWDNMFEIRNLVSTELSAKVVIYPSDENLVLCYVSDGMIGTKIIHENSVVEKTDFTAIDLLNPEDKILSESKGKIIPWYGNYFITCGYQEIKNLAAPANNKRLVFYFSKFRYEK
ncbi:MAG: hypothetical protein WCK34_04050 [Bacteroidota bacterium]